MKKRIPITVYVDVDTSHHSDETAAEEATRCLVADILDEQIPSLKPLVSVGEVDNPPTHTMQLMPTKDFSTELYMATPTAGSKPEHTDVLSASQITMNYNEGSSQA